MTDPVAAYTAALHRTVDELVAPLAQRLAPRLTCRRGCAGCCVDELTVFEVEAERIQALHPEVLDGEAAPPGRCAMLGAEGECRVYAARPYVCRTQGLPLRWSEGGQERRDICPLNDDGSPLADLPADACWTLGPVEARLAATQARRDGGAERRVSLRSLFRSAPSGPQANR